MNDTNQSTQETYEDRCARLNAQIQAQSQDPFVTLVDEGIEKSRLISANADILGDLCAADNPSQLDQGSVATLMRHVKDSADRLFEIMEEFDDLHRQVSKPEQPDTESDDPDEPLSAAAVEVAQQFDTFDAEQQDTLRRVMREFAV